MDFANSGTQLSPLKTPGIVSTPETSKASSAQDGAVPLHDKDGTSSENVDKEPIVPKDSTAETSSIPAPEGPVNLEEDESEETIEPTTANPITFNSVNRMVLSGISTIHVYQDSSNPRGKHFPAPSFPPSPFTRRGDPFEVNRPIRSSPDSRAYDVVDDAEPEVGKPKKSEKPVTYVPKVQFTVVVKDRYGDRSKVVYLDDKPSAIFLGAKKYDDLPVIESKITLISLVGNRYDDYGAPDRIGEQPEFRPLPGEERTIESKTLIIHSPVLANAIRAVVQYYPGENILDTVDMDKIMEFNHPYRLPIHHMDALVEYKSLPRPEHTGTYNKECDEHIDVLLNFLTNHSEIRVEEEEARWNRPVPLATFENLWLLFKPGCDVYVSEGSELTPYVIMSVQGGVTNRSARDYMITAWNIDFNGVEMGRSERTFFVAPFDGEREIRSLNIFPTRFHEDKKGAKPLRDRLIERGKAFFEMCRGPAYREYTGDTISTPRRIYKRARIIVDTSYEPWNRVTSSNRTHMPSLMPRGHNRYRDDYDRPPALTYQARTPQVGIVEGEGTGVAGCRCEACFSKFTGPLLTLPKVKFSDYDAINPKVETKLKSDHQYFLCAAVLYGYILKDRKWHLLDVFKIHEVNINTTAIDRLVMSTETDKAMIKAICQQYTHGQDQDDLYTADIIQGKGEGQIFLLHGPPGTGKTLTAECVAEYTRRPLISITAGDLGSEPYNLEQKLDEFFRQGKDWDAIVLLDEADVYLEARRAHDLERNSIVSVFLRSLEYYQGILFITTNRVGTFDEAFASRIHVQLHYKALDSAARAAVWTNNFERLKVEGYRGGQPVDVDRDAKDYVFRSKEVHDLAWNGREIRNGFQTAIALAVYESKEGTPVLKEEHLAQVVRMSSAFKQYVREMYHNQSQEERAQAMQIRAAASDLGGRGRWE